MGGNVSCCGDRNERGKTAYGDDERTVTQLKPLRRPKDRPKSTDTTNNQSTNVTNYQPNIAVNTTQLSKDQQASIDLENFLLDESQILLSSKNNSYINDTYNTSRKSSQGVTGRLTKRQFTKGQVAANSRGKYTYYSSKNASVQKSLKNSCSKNHLSGDKTCKLIGLQSAEKMHNDQKHMSMRNLNISTNNLNKTRLSIQPNTARETNPFVSEQKMHDTKFSNEAVMTPDFNKNSFCYENSSDHKKYSARKRKPLVNKERSKCCAPNIERIEDMAMQVDQLKIKENSPSKISSASGFSIKVYPCTSPDHNLDQIDEKEFSAKFAFQRPYALFGLADSESETDDINDNESSDINTSLSKNMIISVLTDSITVQNSQPANQQEYSLQKQSNLKEDLGCSNILSSSQKSKQSVSKLTLTADIQHKRTQSLPKQSRQSANASHGDDKIHTNLDQIQQEQQQYQNVQRQIILRLPQAQ